MTAVITFARSASGGRVERMPIIGAFTIGTKKPQTATAAQATGHEMSAAIAQSGSVAQAIAALARWSGWMRSSSFDAATRADHRADAEAREEPAGDVHVAVVARVRDQRHGDGDRAGGAVEDDHGQRHRPEQAVAPQVVDAREHAARVVVLRDAAAALDEERDAREREEERARRR